MSMAECLKLIESVRKARHENSSISVDEAITRSGEHYYAIYIDQRPYTSKKSWQECIDKWLSK